MSKRWGYQNHPRRGIVGRKPSCDVVRCDCRRVWLRVAHRVGNRVLVVARHSFGPMISKPLTSLAHTMHSRHECRAQTPQEIAYFDAWWAKKLGTSPARSAP